MNAHRQQILEMLAAGKITAEEAERLIAATEKEKSSGPAANGAESTPRPKTKYLRVVVEDNGDEGPINVNIRVPLQLLRAGVKLASLVPPQARDRLNVAMSEHGVPFDLSQVKPENVDDLVDLLQDLTVDVNGNRASGETKTKVRIFCE